MSADTARVDSRDQVRDFLDLWAEPFARALAVFVGEALRLGLPRQAEDFYAGPQASTPPHASDITIPAEVLEKWKAEVAKNEQLMAAGKLRPVRLTENSPVIAAANHLQHVLREKGISQKELAARLGVTPSAISKVFKNPDRSKLATLRRIADAIGVGVETIV